MVCESSFSRTLASSAGVSALLMDCLDRSAEGTSRYLMRYGLFLRDDLFGTPSGITLSTLLRPAVKFERCVRLAARLFLLPSRLKLFN